MDRRQVDEFNNDRTGGDQKKHLTRTKSKLPMKNKESFFKNTLYMIGTGAWRESGKAPGRPGVLERSGQVKRAQKRPHCTFSFVRAFAHGSACSATIRTSSIAR